MIIVEKSQLKYINDNEIELKEVGQKAYGLLQIPKSWTPAFFVISKSLFDDYFSVSEEDRETIIDAYLPNIIVAIRESGLDSAVKIILRSSGLIEGMNERGRFVSIPTYQEQIKETLKTLLDSLLKITSNDMPIVVQGYIKANVTGHMSNERRFSFDSRDWKIEYYFEDDSFEQDTVCIRKWRKTYNIDDISSQHLLTKNIKKELNKVAYFWHELGKNANDRFHLEFVYDDNNLYIVQADKELLSEESVNPMEMDVHIHSKPCTLALNVLKKFEPKKKCKFNKLNNVHSYAALGLVTVPLYILDNEIIIEEIKQGNIPVELKEDLEKLLDIQPVVVRTDIVTSNRGSAQLLPRSNEIKDYNTLKEWLVENSIKLSANKNIVFIFHNFIPAISSAFAHAVPNNRIVEIQSLWGLPEGLYYNAHDTIIVTLPAKPLDLIKPEDLQVQIKRKYKDVFVTPSKEGAWKVRKISPPYDWRCSVDNKSIFNIAVNSQKIANHSNQEISIMWFVNIDEKYYGSNCLAWFHEPYNSSSYTPDDYKRKRFVDEEFTVCCSDDLIFLEKNCENIRCLRMKPTSDEDLRSKDFIKKVGEFACKYNINILLEGAQLTHTYYQLKNTNAVVVCASGSELDVTSQAEFNKLVRDLIPEKIFSNGEIVTCVKANDILFDRLLLEKLLEESFEAFDAEDEKSFLEELADIAEICSTIKQRIQAKSFSTIDIRNNRRDERDVLSEGIISTKIDYDNFQNYNFVIGSLYLHLKIERQKTIYRVELQISNLPLKSNTIEISSDRICHETTKLIIQTASSALNEKNSECILSKITEIEELIKKCCEALKCEYLFISNIGEKKNEKNGAFNNGYVLLKTNLISKRDKEGKCCLNLFLDDSGESFHPNNIATISSIDTNPNKYYDYLQREKNKALISVLRFNVPISVNSWQIVFENKTLKKWFSKADKLRFSFSKDKQGVLKMSVDTVLEPVFEQFSLY